MHRCTTLLWSSPSSHPVNILPVPGRNFSAICTSTLAPWNDPRSTQSASTPGDTVACH
ncbi:hypothetical protein PISMIDRAFT_673711 [Pisolithus microcarpus 441]|uniref:Uncharacterized protein n=1 Tax=Pisolithus microcarpus 441 TaxID=765257 RepID=A0A0C9YUG5_9AGAM|nr:hypothetical protein PISMIDRAFT_673711 [Pisolithus microcarpus 441]